MRPLFAAGLGFWAPGFPTLAARLRGVADPACVEPPCALLPSRMARRASLLTRMTLEAISQSVEGTGVDLRKVPTVFATARGEMQTLSALLEMLGADGQLSPTRFHNSVYNAAAGQFSVAVGNQAFSTTLVGGSETVPLALLEGFCALHALEAPAVVVAFADEAISLPFLSNAGSESLACAICLTREPCAGAPSLACPTRGTPPRGPLGASLDTSVTNPVAAAILLLRALRGGDVRGALPLETPDGWSVELGSAR